MYIQKPDHGLRRSWKGFCGGERADDICSLEFNNQVYQTKPMSTGSIIAYHHGTSWSQTKEGTICINSVSIGPSEATSAP